MLCTYSEDSISVILYSVQCNNNNDNSYNNYDNNNNNINNNSNSFLV